MKTPVAVLSYNRPNYTENVLKFLSECHRLDECQVVIYCDAPKKAEHAEAVEASRVVVRSWQDKLGAEVVMRDENYGLALTTITAANDLTKNYGRLIVLEDDLTVHNRFLDYMLQGLDKYQDAENVFQISGFMFPMAHPEGDDAWLMPLSTTVGWATWERAWSHFDPDPKDWQRDLADTEFRDRLNVGGAMDFASMLRQRMAGHNQSWGVLWYYALVKARALALQPRNTLVWVGGFDNTGVHCGGMSPLYAHDKERVLSQVFSEKFKLPDEIQTDEEAFARVRQFLASHKPGWARRIGSLLKSGLRKALGGIRPK